MIWFDCKKCNKTLSRPESSAGALVFCDCGMSLRVPWESTAAPAADTYPLAREEPLAPVRFELAAPPPSATFDEVSLPRLRRRTDEIDPDYCFNHPSEPKNAACADCNLGLCKRCSTTLRGQTLCAPCKNYRTRLQQRRPELVKWAAASFAAALLAAPVLLGLTPVLLAQRSTWITLLAMIPLFFALGAGVWAMVMIGRSASRVGGNLALGGITLASTVGTLLLMVTLFSHKFGI
jgi:hypothetical protein